MKKVICILIAISMMMTLVVPVFAQENDDPWFGTIHVEYTNTPGTLEHLEVMVYKGYVYVDAQVISERLGYRCEKTEDLISIYAPVRLYDHTAPMLAVHFQLDGTKVSYNPLFGMEYEYEAPCPTVQNDRGVWVPLRYTLDLLGGGSNLLKDVLRIQMPYENVLSVAAIIANYSESLAFDWTHDFGYTEGWIMTADGAARVVTLLDGLLKFDSSSWSVALDWGAFDKKFGRMLTTMICTKSNEEFKEEIEQVEQILDIFEPDSTFGELLRQEKISLDTDLGGWKAACDKYLEMVKSGAGSTAEYNRMYAQMEKAMDRQDLFSSLGGDALIYVQDGLSTATNVLDVAAKIGTVVTYYQEFQNTDAFSLSALQSYLRTHTRTDEMSRGLKEAVLGHAAALQADGTFYAVTSYIEDNLTEIMVDASGLDAMLGLPANIALMAWDIMSDTIPFYEGGLAAVENREISNYAQKLQNDARENLNTMLTGMKSGTISLDSQECMKLAEYCYVFLKTCYIARDSAIKSLDLENKDEDFLKEAKGTIDGANDTNDQIAYYLAILSQANEQNEGMILGFLPENNEKYLNGNSDDTLINNVKDNSITTDSDKLVTEVKNYTASGQLYATYSFQYNENNKIIKQTYHEEGYDLIYEYSYNEAGEMTEMLASSGEYPSERYTYDEQGLLVEADLGFGTGRYEYDTQGRRIKSIEEYDVQTYITRYYYDNNTLVKKVEYVYPVGSMHENATLNPEDAEIVTYTYEYDNQNRVVAISYVAEKEFIPGGATHCTTYDYSYKPFTIVTHMRNDEILSIGVVMMMDAYGDWYSGIVFSQGNYGLDDSLVQQPEVFVDESGYIVKIISHDRTNHIYEFAYSDELP